MQDSDQENSAGAEPLESADASPNEALGIQRRDPDFDGAAWWAVDSEEPNPSEAQDFEAAAPTRPSDAPLGLPSPADYPYPNPSTTFFLLSRWQIFWIAGLNLVLGFGGVVLVHSAHGDSPASQHVSQNACIESPVYLSADVDTVVNIDVTVSGGPCPIYNIDKIVGDATGRPAEGYSAHQTQAGNQARLEIVSPLFPGEIRPINDTVQSINLPDHPATWAWQLKANEPGSQQLSLVLSTIDDKGLPTSENPRVAVDFYVQNTLGHAIETIGAGISEFFTSIAGIVTSLLVVGGGVASTLAWLARRRKGQT